mgnify:CR=1 FL=1
MEINLNLIHIKLKNGEDLIGVRETTQNPTSTDGVWVVAPITVDIHPIHGLYGKSWMLLSDANTVKINNEDIMFLSNANLKAEKYYETFISKFREVEDDPDLTSEEYLDELDELYSTILESKTSTKH